MESHGAGGVSRSRPVPTVTPPGSRGPVHPHHAGGGGRIRAARPALLRGEGLDRHAAAGPEGLLAVAAAVPGHARRHRAQLPRGDRVPRPAGGRARGPAGGGLGPGVDRRRPGGRGARAPPVAEPAADEDAARRHHGPPFRRRLRRGPARRGEGPGQGAGVLVSRRVRPVGPEEPAARAVGALQRPAPPGRAHPGLPAVGLDRARHLAVHRPGAGGDPVHLLLPPPARSSGATGCCSRSGPTRAR